jgi:hypothetical protein
MDLHNSSGLKEGFPAYAADVWATPIGPVRPRILLADC